MPELILLSQVLYNMLMTLVPNISQIRQLMKKKKSMAKNKRSPNHSTLAVAKDLLLLNKPSSRKPPSLMTMDSKLSVLVRIEKLEDRKLSNINMNNLMMDSRLSETLEVREKEVPLMP